ncbi:MAG: DNA polymerase III subunit gamma/tau, partial [Elusimicrobiota bacterium]|nr:DNA polymerase III subunit gamma/tau [Elusimicrobiota bacterium]
MVLARKFRPKDFDEVIGQEHISKVLKNAISENKIAHAYIFSGPRGVGKTTTARIFAKALNCKEGPIPHPCGVCNNCLEISKGISIDVLEMDGASNTGIEHARTLIENVKFVPSSSKYKIYIIDEAHRISTAAFDALLKTIEEPPEHIVFILATTEQHKIPATIFSRCQSFRFKLVSSKEISQRIKEIAEQENFEIDEEAIGIITAASGGSVRDALSLLDQAVSSSSSKLTGEYVRELLGLLPKDIIVSMTDYIAEGNAAKILKIIDDVSSEGYNILELAKNLRDYLRELMIYSINPKTKEMLGSDKIFFEKQKDLFSI